MPDTFSDQDIKEAMDTCADEPAHIPGIVQPFACLLGVDAKSERIFYASENCEDVIGHSVGALLDKGLGDTFGRKLVHDIKNALNQLQADNKANWIGTHMFGDRSVEGYAFRSGPGYVVEFEPERDSGMGSTDALQVLRFLMMQIQDCADEAALLKLTVRLMRHLTGYDRVMAYRFDNDYNGEIAAEAASKGMEPFLGLRFPHWDIPAQARAIMEKLPLRFIQDVHQVPVPLRAERADLPPLDITYAACRGVSPVHMQYLQNMQIRATMTLSIVVDGKLWGMISFHHRRAKTPPPRLREVLTSFAEVFTMKLKMLRQQERLQLVARVDALKDDLLGQIENDKTLADALPKLGPLVQEVMDACGTVVVVGSKVLSTGQVPEQALVERLQKEAKAEPLNLIAIDNLADRFPELASSFNGCAGALVVAIGPERAFCIFRTEQVQNVLWAGNPEKTIGQHEGKARLEPRGSFSAYLQEVENSCNAWSELDQYFARSIWALVNAAERQALMKTLNRQQKLMIDELNHRVRNILSLVRSVSKQARRRYGSLSSYAKSLESRIMALAAAHDIASGSEISVVELKSLIAQELAPYLKDEAADVSGPDKYLHADIAPIFALVIHELVTNAAKYGALSNGVGTVSVVVTEKSDGTEVFWQERGGPQVEEPEERGFGTVLIESALQYELGGEATLEFLPNGVEARLFLPNNTMEMDATSVSGKGRVGKPIDLHNTEPFVADGIAGHVLLVEDNFIIAQEMHDQISDFGFSEIEVCSNCKDALAFLEGQKPALAILDVNLGMDQTSLPIAEELVRMNVPFLFVTGYGDTLELPEGLDHIVRLTKPVSDTGLNAAIGKLLAPSGRPD